MLVERAEQEASIFFVLIVELGAALHELLQHLHVPVARKHTDPEMVAGPPAVLSFLNLCLEAPHQVVELAAAVGDDDRGVLYDAHGPVIERIQLVAFDKEDAAFIVQNVTVCDDKRSFERQALVLSKLHFKSEMEHVVVMFAEVPHDINGVSRSRGNHHRRLNFLLFNKLREVKYGFT